MAIMDAKLEIDDGLALTAISSAAQSATNEIRLDAATALMKDAWGTTITPDPGVGGGLVMNFKIGTVFTSAAIIKAKIFSHTTSGVTSGAEIASVTFASGATTAAGECSVTGSHKGIRLPSGTIQRFLGVQYSMVSGASGAGTIDAWLSLDSETPSS